MKIESQETEVRCENGHPVHLKCLKSWVRAAELLSSDEIFCPICHLNYSKDVIVEIFGIKQEFKERKQQFQFELQLHSKPEAKGITWQEYMKKLNLAQENIERFNYEIGILHLFEILQENPNDVNAIFLFGMANFQRGNYILAQHFFYKTLELDPNNYLANIFLAEILLFSGKKRESITLFKKAKEILDKMLTREEKEQNEDWKLVIKRLSHLTRVNYI
ncbi:MAG: hypothetical protein ACTSXP_02095 [Promethearchaeota archaeon]